MTDEKLEDLIRLAKEAYQGTWHSTGVAVMAEGEGGMECVANMGDCLGLWQANSLYIEAVRPSSILQLIERLNNAESEAKRLAEILAQQEADAKLYLNFAIGLQDEAFKRLPNANKGEAS